MACSINGNTVKRGITNFLDNELSSSNIFRKEDGVYVTKASQYFAAQQFVSGLNRRFSENVVRRLSDKNYSISIPDNVIKDYLQSSQEGQELITLVGMYGDFTLSPASWNENETFMALNYPEISEFTYNKLIDFLKSLNPNFRVEEIDNLSEDGVTNVKDFLIKVKTMAKFSAMPEEVAHAFIELLPDNNALKVDMINNITSYPVYSQTLARYKDVYTKEDGSPDYDKIKREAAAKLVAEYVTAISTDDFTRVKTLGKARQSWFERWFGKFLEWLGMGMNQHTNSYADIAGVILSGETDMTLKNEKEIQDISYSDSYFFRMSEQSLYDNAIEIMAKRPPQLLETITNFTKEFGKKFNEILKDEKYKELNEMLKKKGTEIGKVNRLSEIKILLDEADIDLDAALDSVSYVTGIKQFLEAVDRLDILSESILKVINNKEKAKTFDEAIKNITELEGYFGIYETFKNIVSADLTNILIEAGVASEIIESINRTKLGFDNVNDHILSKLKNDLFIFYKSMMQESNSIAVKTLEADIANAEKLGNQNAVDMFKKRLNDLVMSDEDIIKMLSGKGRDIDNFSGTNHLINAAKVNGDIFISTIAKYVEDRVQRAQLVSRPTVQNLYQRIDVIQKALGEDAVATGKRISFADTVYDKDTGEVRQVLTWLNPHKNIQPALDAHRRAVKDAAIKRADVDKNSPEFKELDAEFKRVQGEYYNFLEKYYNRPFVSEYYNFKKKYDANTDYINAITKWQEMSDTVNDLEKQLAAEPENDDLWEQLSQAKRNRSNLLNEFDKTGKTKSESELREVRILKEFFEESQKFREEDEVQTERAYETARNRYMQKVDYAIAEAKKENPKDIQEVEESLQESLQDSRIRIVTLYDEVTDPDSPIDYGLVKDLVMQKWRKKNVSIQRNDEFYEFEAELKKELDELQQKGELTDIELALKQAYDDLHSILFGTKDNIGHINPAALNDEEKQAIIDLENLIFDLKQEKPGLGLNLDDFTSEDRTRYEDLSEFIADPLTKGPDKRLAIRQRNDIAKKYKNTGKNKAIRDLINLLGSLTEKKPTIYYWDRLASFVPLVAEFGRFMKSLDLEEAISAEIMPFVTDFIAAVDTEDWERLDFVIYEKEFFDAFLDWLRTANLEQYNWFVDNHSQKSIFDPENNMFVQLKYARSAVYKFTEPVLKEHRKEVKNRRFRKQRVKDEYRTGYNPDTKKVELQVGVHITNREYNGFPEFLPLLPEQGAPVDSPYRNEEYYKLRDNDELRFKYLTELRNANLAEQEKLPPEMRHWNEVPVMQLSNIEELQLEHIKDVAQEKWDYVKSIFKKDDKTKAGTAGDAEAELRGEDTVKEINQFTQTTITQRIPKLGMYQKVPIDRVSRDLLKSTAQMIIRAHEFSGRVKAEPVVQSLIRVLKYSERNEEARKFREGSNKQRVAILEKIYSQMILQEVPDTTLNNKAIRRIASFLTGNTALRMLADPIGGTINYMSAMVNNVIEASAGKYLNLAELAQGKLLAFRVNTALMADYNKKANLSVDTLLFDTFEFVQGDFEEDLLDRSSSKDKHASIRQMLMIPRKSGELMAQTAIAMGMLERVKVLNSIDGKSYPAHEIYTKEEGGNTLVLKKGFPEEWNPIDGEKFLKMKNLIHRVNFELHGNYAKLSQSEASRYALGKLAENMKRWFMPAFQRRFGRETIDISFEDLNEGYYRTSARAARNIFGAMFHLDFGGAKSWAQIFWTTPRYRQNLQRMGAEMAQAFILFVIFALLLGYSGDDKSKQLDKNSWIHNTAILIAMRVYSETTAYIPFPPFGFQEMKRNVLSPFSLPADAVSNFAAIGQLGLYQVLYWFGVDGLQDDLYYSKDSGYWYSEAGDSKLFKYVLRTLGYTGYTGVSSEGLDGKQVGTFIKQFDNLQGRLK